MKWLVQYGQPIGAKVLNFSNFLATIARGKDFSLSFEDWRDIDPIAKDKVWDTIKSFYDVPEEFKDWVIASLHKKWRDFKCNLKRKIFKEKMTDEELMAMWDKRVPKDDWLSLIQYWRSEKFKACSKIDKANRGKKEVNHTSGNKSFARLSHEMVSGKNPTRADLFMVAHTHKKDGSRSGSCQVVLDAMSEKLKEQPELKEKTIQEGDLFSQVSRKERSGHVRLIGFGPKLGDLNISGMKSYSSSKLKAANEARKNTEEEVRVLRESLQQSQTRDEEFRAQMSKQFEEFKQTMLSKQFEEFKKMMLSLPGDASNALQERLHGVGSSPVEDNIAGNNKEGVDSISSRCGSSNEIEHRRIRVLPVPRLKGGGKEVDMISFTKPYICVAKGTLQCTDRKTMVGGCLLGPEYYEVLVNVVIQKHTELPRPFGNIKCLENAIGRCIAWRHHFIKEQVKGGVANYIGNH